MNYKTIAFIMASVFIGVAIYFFIEDSDDQGLLFLWFAFFTYIALYYLLKSIYYLRHGATFNEFVYVVILPFIPPAMIYLKDVLTVGVEQLGYVSLHFDGGAELGMDFIDLLFIPFYFSGVFLLLRTHLRYPFIRFTSHSDGGVPARLMGFLLTIGIPLVYYIFGFGILANLMMVLFAMIIVVSGFLGFFI